MLCGVCVRWSVRARFRICGLRGRIVVLSLLEADFADDDDDDDDDDACMRLFVCCRCCFCLPVCKNPLNNPALKPFRGDTAAKLGSATQS